MQSISTRRWSAIVSLLVCMTVQGVGPRTACAQAPSPDAAGDATAPAADKLAEAKLHFQLGLNHLRDPEGERVEPAYLEFKRTYELSGSLRVLGNIGYCAMKLERYAEAVAAYREYLEKVPNIDPVERQQIDQDLLMMTDGASTIVVRFSEPGEWTLVDERIPVRGDPIKNSYGPYQDEVSLLVHSGHHVVRLYVNGEEQGSWELDSTSSQTQSHVFTPRVLEPAPEPVAAAPEAAPTPEPARPAPAQSRSYVGPWITVGAGAALLIGGAVTGVLALNKMSDLEKQCPKDLCVEPDYKTQVSSARTLGTVTDALVIGGATVTVGGLVWLLLTRSKNREHAGAKPRVTAACAHGGCTFGVHGKF